MCRHILGAIADYDGNIHYEYDDLDQISPCDVFEFCPQCGEKNNPLDEPVTE